MAKKPKTPKEPETKVDEFAEPEVTDLFIGGEDFDVSAMDYPVEETDIIQTMPPETKEEAELLAEATLDEEVAVDDPPSESEEPPDDKKLAESEEEPEEIKAADEEPAEPEPAEPDDRGERIPHSRFKEVVDERNELRERIAKLEDGTQTVVTPEPVPEPSEVDKELEALEVYDFDKREEEYMDAVNEGEKEAARNIRKEIRTTEQRISELRAEKIVSKMTGAQSEEAAFLETAEALQNKYPILDNNSETFDKDKQADVIDLFKGYALSGEYSRADALRKATEKIAHLERWGEDTDTPPADPAPTNIPPDVKKKVEASNKQPQAMGTTQTPDVGAPDIAEISEEEFASLPEDTKRRLRGDYVTA